ncbi:MAG: beta-lactamase family protein [Clostridia bacterium]|nr:beta-lactamase family protein [Clostridia bacterium]
MIEKIIDQIIATGANLYSLVSIEDGEVHSYTINPANPCNDTYSVAKAYTMTAIGLCYDRGLLKPTDKVCDIFRDQLPAGMDERWELVTIHDVLRHRMGTTKGYLDIDVEDINNYPTDDFLSMVFSPKLELMPGEKYCYSDAAYYLLSRIVTQVSGEGMDDMLMRDILRPTGCREAGWSKCPRGYAMGATGLYIRCLDVARLAQLYLDEGMWEGKRLLSVEWVNMAKENAYSLNPCRNGAYTKGGMRGQRFYFNPNTRVALGWLAYDKEGKTGQILELLADTDI